MILRKVKSPSGRNEADRVAIEAAYMELYTVTQDRKKWMVHDALKSAAVLIIGCCIAEICAYVGLSEWHYIIAAVAVSAVLVAMMMYIRDTTDWEVHNIINKDMIEKSVLSKNIWYSDISVTERLSIKQPDEGVYTQVVIDSYGNVHIRNKDSDRLEKGCFVLTETGIENTQCIEQPGKNRMLLVWIPFGEFSGNLEIGTTDGVGVIAHNL